jgi:outer membrane receptor protein involved in Fe transport
MMKILVLVLVSILTVSGYAYGQAPMARQGNMPADGKLSGKIVDSSTSQPVEYASIAIYRQKDSTLVNGVVTDAAGSFNMENLPYGRFYAVITFIGYQKKNVEAITITPDNKLASLGTLKLEPASTALNEVVVMGNGNQMEYKIDKKIVNISQNIVASGGTVVDALQNTPSVQTDVEGNLTLRGSSNFTVLIDGKPSVVSGSEALQQIPAGLVQNVEIITNPSAKYDAEGSAGIINVIMKKQKVKGFNGSVSLSAGTNKKYNESVNLNFKYNKWNFMLGADYRDMAFEMNHQSERSYFNEGVLYKSQLLNGSGRFNRTGYGFRGGVDYAIDNKNSLSLTGRWGNRAFNRPMTAFYREQKDINPSLPGLEPIYYTTRNGGDSDDDFYSLNLDYTLNLNDKGHQLTASAYYSGSDENDPSETRQDTTDVNWNILPDSSYFQRVDETGDEKEFRFKTDYTLPINDKTKLEAGMQTQFDITDSKHRLFKNEVEDLGQHEDLNFDQNINAAYATFSSSTKFFDFQVGLRAENENRKIESLDTSFLQLFPTIHLSRKLPWDIQVQASYTRRISRPRQWDLSPLVRYMDPQNVRVGNPALSPELTDAYELNVQKKINEMSFFSVEGFYRKTNNPIQQFTVVSNGINTMTFDNLGKSESIGAEAMLNFGLTKWWTLNGSGSVYNYKLTGDMEDASSKSSTNWNLNANTMVRLKTGTSLQLNYMYNAPSVTAQGTRGSFYTAGLAVRQDLLKRKASLTLQYRDFIGDLKMKNTTDTPDLKIYNVMKRETNVFTVTFTYRINNYKAQNKRNSEEMNNGNDMGGEMDMM